LLFTGCSEQGPLEKTGEAIDESIESSKEAVDEAIDKSAEKIEDIRDAPKGPAEKTGKRIDDAAEDFKDTIEEAVDELEEKVRFGSKSRNGHRNSVYPGHSSASIDLATKLQHFCNSLPTYCIVQDCLHHPSRIADRLE